MTDSFIYAYARTPFGRFDGALADWRPDDLAAAAVTAVLAQAPELSPESVRDVVWGCANQAGEDNRNVGRMAVLLAGLPTSVPAVTVNRLCGSSLDAAIQGSRAIETGDADVVLVGGVESMTRAPWVLPKPSRAFPAGNSELVSTTLGWRLVNEKMPAEWTTSLGECNELLAERFGISRVRQDEFAARSHNLADAAWSEGFYEGLARAAIDWSEVAAVELNEAFAVQSLACVDAWLAEGLRDPDLVNAKGGAIAIGHLLGASGGRVLATLAERLRRAGDRWGVAAICIGVGQALAVVLENVEASA